MHAYINIMSKFKIFIGKVCIHDPVKSEVYAMVILWAESLNS